MREHEREHEQKPGAVLEIKDLTVKFTDRVAFSGLNFTLERGQIAVIGGQSGAGKTTMLRCIAGLSPFEGSIRVNGAAVCATGLSGGTPDCALVTQQANLWDHMTALENVALVRRLVRKETRRQARQSAMAFLTALDMGAMANRYPFRLSGGEQQRVALARGLAAERPLLLLDEVTSAIDPSRRQIVVDTLKRLSAGGVAVLVISHDESTGKMLGGSRFGFTAQGLTRVEEGH